MEHEIHRQRQKAVLSEMLKVLENDPRVLGVIAVGSYTAGTIDAFSDIDIVCFLRDEARTGREELYRKVGSLKPLLCQLWLWDIHALYLFDDGVRLDLDFKAP